MNSELTVCFLNTCSWSYCKRFSAQKKSHVHGCTLQKYRHHSPICATFDMLFLTYYDLGILILHTKYSIDTIVCKIWNGGTANELRDTENPNASSMSYYFIFWRSFAPTNIIAWTFKWGNMGICEESDPIWQTRVDAGWGKLKHGLKEKEEKHLIRIK